MKRIFSLGLLVFVVLTLWASISTAVPDDQKALPEGAKLSIEVYATSITYAPHGKIFVTTANPMPDEPSTVYLWDAETGLQLAVLIPPTSTQNLSLIRNKVAYGPDWQTLASIGRGGKVFLWDAESLELLRTLSEHTGRVSDIAYSPDGTFLATAGHAPIPVVKEPDGTYKTGPISNHDTKARLWRVGDGTLEKVFRGHKSGINSIAYSPDGISLATASSDGTLQLWSVATGGPLNHFGYQDAVLAVAYSPDRKTIAAGVGNIVFLHDVVSGKTAKKLHGKSDVLQIKYAPNGKTLVTANSGSETTQSVDLWDVASGRLVKSFQGCQGVAYSPDGQTLVIGEWDAAKSRVVLWDINFLIR